MPGSNFPNVIAIDLGAESCRVSLLRWSEDKPHIELVHRFGNSPVSVGASVHWNLQHILAELDSGLMRCAERCAEPIASIGVDGWAVDCVRMDQQSFALGDPYCYRDARTEETFAEMESRCPSVELFLRSGVQPLRINTMYQLMADQKAGVPASTLWANLPEYVLARFGGRLVAEYTNATHTGLVDLRQHAWNKGVFDLAGLSVAAAPELVATGTDLGQFQDGVGESTALLQTRLIAVACHDTASAVAAIPIEGDDWAYLSSGTWSLLGTLLDAPIMTAEAGAAGFTNLGAAGNRICFHKNLNGMWLLKQTMLQLCPEPDMWPMAELVAAAEAVDAPEQLLDVDDPSLLLPGSMASRINAQRACLGAPQLEEHTSAMPQFASLIFHSLANRYAETLHDLEALTGKRLKRLAIVGGGSLNQFLNRLTAEATGLEIFCGVAESSTIGNFAVQLASLEGKPNSATRIPHWARALTSLHHC
jgi:rhamnulokinase